MHLFRAASLNGFNDIAQQFNINVSSLLRAAGLPRDCLSPKNADRYYSSASFEKLHALLEIETGRSDLAAMHGRNQEISALLGVLGFYVQQGRTVGEALGVFEHYISFQAQGVSMVSYEQESLTVIEFIVKDAYRLESIRYLTEYALAAATSVLSSLCGAHWKPQAIYFIHAPPEKPASIQKHYSAPISFGCEHNAVLLKSEDLAIPIATANPQLKEILQKSLTELEERFSNDLISQVEHLVHAGLLSGKCNADSIALFLGIHRRTMHRLLKEHGTSFTEILTNTRKSMAKSLLKQSGLPLTKVSLLLGYAELSAFSRAFKGWTGMSASEYRKQ